MRVQTSIPVLSAAFAFLLPAMALAHPGHEHRASFIEGLVHPLSGADHVLAMVLVGLLAVQLGGRAIWILPATFLAGMAAGSSVGATGIGASAVEFGIALSVIALGLIVALQARLPLAAAAVLVGATALLHGHAHGAEADGMVSSRYILGFLAGTLGLHAAGIAAGVAMAGLAQGRARSAARIVGGVAAGAGLLLAAG